VERSREVEEEGEKGREEMER
jgi:hypothetical protein